MRRSATGQRGSGVRLSIVDFLVVPPLSTAGRSGLCAGRGADCWWRVGDPGLPTETERAAHQRVVAADRGGRAPLEGAPAYFVFDLFVALLDPVAQPVAAHPLGQVGRQQPRLVTVTVGQGA